MRSARLSTRQPTASRRSRERGVTLVELMVGLTIGLLATLVITQVMSVSESQKRSTTSGSDAQLSGALALFAVERDVKMAGYGFSSTPNALGCAISATFGGAAVPDLPAELVPVSITPGGAGVSDTLRILASNKADFSVPLRVMPPEYKPNDTTFWVASSRGVAQNDLMLAFVDETQPCMLFRVTAPPPVSHVEIPRADDGGWNAAGFPGIVVGQGSQLLNLGTLLDHTYQVDAGSAQFQRVTFDTTTRTQNTMDLQAGIVLFKAMYGRDTVSTIAQLQAGLGRVDTYDYTTPATPEDWQRVLAVRLVLVARSGQFEREDVTTTNPLWDVGNATAVAGAAACGASQCVSLDVGAGVAGAEARRYRYKVYDTVVPLINMLWRS